EHDAVEGPIRAADEQERAEDEDRHQPHAADPPADEREQTGDAEKQEPRLQDVAGRNQRSGPGSPPSAPPGGPSSSSRPRGGQSSFCGASQRLEQWREAMFWSGTRMWPFSSMWATSST